MGGPPAALALACRCSAVDTLPVWRMRDSEWAPEKAFARAAKAAGFAAVCRRGAHGTPAVGGGTVPGGGSVRCLCCDLPELALPAHLAIGPAPWPELDATDARLSWNEPVLCEEGTVLGATDCGGLHTLGGSDVCA